MCSTGVAEGGLSAEEAFALLPAVLDALTSAPWWQLSGPDLAAWIVALHACESRVSAAGTFALGEAISRGLPSEDGAKTGGAWFRGLVPVTTQAAKARAALAEALGTDGAPVVELAPTRAAFAAGAVSAGHAGVVVRTLSALDGVPDVDEVTRGEAQQLLLAEAGRIDPAQLGRAGMRLRHRLHPDAAEQLARDEDATERAREAYLVQESGGMWHLSARLAPLAGAALAAALDPLTLPAPAQDGTPDPRSAKQRCADGLVLLAKTSLAARPGGPGSLPTRAGSPTRLVVTGELSSLLADLHTADGRLALTPGVVQTGEPGGWDVSPLTLQVIACDAEVVPMLLDGAGGPLDVGQTRYPFGPKIRKAIEARDQHCTYPGCSAKPPWCDAHHLVPFSNGGSTSAANGGLLCGRHHRLVHARGMVGRLVDGHVNWRDPRTGEDRSNAYTQEFEQALRQLALRWRARNPQLHDAERGPTPPT
jgi:hypothetical protein